MSPLAFFEQLADTPWSMALHESEIAYSIIESVLVWSLVDRQPQPDIINLLTSCTPTE
jgi:hypothetical protein